MKGVLSRIVALIYRWFNKVTALRGNVVIGSGFVVGAQSYLKAPDQIVVGDHVHIGRNFFLACNGKIGNGVLISSYVSVVGQHDHDMKAVGHFISLAPWLYAEESRSTNETDEIDIGDDVWIGFGAILLSGISIGRGAVIGAGSVVTKNVLPYEIVVGVPAKKSGMRFSEAEIDRHERLLKEKFG